MVILTMNNIEILEQLLLEKKIKQHFAKDEKIIKINLEDLYQLFIDFLKLIKNER